MKRRIVWLLLSCLVAASLVLASCAPAAPAAPTAPTAPVAPTIPAAPTIPTTPVAPTVPTAEVPKYGGVLRIVEANTPQGFAPVLISKTASYANNYMLESLWGGEWTKGGAGTNEIGFFVFVGTLYFWGPRLATSWEKPDEETLIWHIRKGVRYALDPNNEASRLVNGREFTAEDAAYSLNKWYFDPEGYWQLRVPERQRPVSITATDKYTLVIKAKPGTISDVMYNSSDWSCTFPPEVYEKYNKMRDLKNIVGTGPFIFKDYVPDSSIIYERNPNYWDKNPIGPGKGDQLPYLDTVKILIIKDLSTRMAALRTGKVDVLSGLPPSLGGLKWEDAETMLKTTPDLKYARYLSRGPTGIALRVDKPELPWYNLKVRQALTMAIDYNTIIKDYFRGNAQLVWPVVPYGQFIRMYTPPEEWTGIVKDIHTYQPEKAKKILAEAGYPNGFTIKAVTEPTYIDELSIIKEYWKAIGVNLELDVKERTVFLSTTQSFKHEQAAGQSLSAGVPYAFQPYNPTDILNTARINDSRANETFATITNDYMFNEPKVWPIMKEYFQYVLEQAWYIQFPAPYVAHMWWPWLKNYHGQDYMGNSARHYWAKYIWIDQALKKSTGF